MNPRQLINLALITGPYGKGSSFSRMFGGLSLKKLIDSKHGIHLSDLEPRIPEVLNTKDGKIQIAAEVFLEGLKNLKSSLGELPKERQKNEFKLIGRRHLRSNNSWMHNVEGLIKGKNRCTVMIHPDDAKRLNIEDEQIVEVKSRTGEINIPIEITDKIMPGVLSLSLIHISEPTRPY